MDLQINIDLLTLEGMTGINENNLQEMIREALMQLIESNGLPSHFAQTHCINLPDDLCLKVDTAASPMEVAKQIAAAIYYDH